METMLNVTRFSSFEEAFASASKTKEMFEAFQTGNKLKIVKQYAQDYFVDTNKELWYSSFIEGIRRLHKLNVYSCLSNREMEYVQIMKNTLRFTGQYVSLDIARKYSKEMEEFSVYKG